MAGIVDAFNQAANRFSETIAFIMRQPAVSIGAIILFLATILNLYIQKKRLEKGMKYALVSSFIALATVFVLLIVTPPSSPQYSEAYFVFDYYAKLFSLLGLAVTLVICVSAYNYLRDLPDVPVFYALLTGTAIGLILLPSAVDIFGLFLAWELLSVPLYVMVMYNYDKEKSVEGAMKYFVMGSISSVFLGLGIGLLTYLGNTSNIYEISVKLAELGASHDPLTHLAVVALIVGLGVKTTIVPFHWWAPDTYEGAAPPVTAYLSGTIKAIRFAALIKLILILPDWMLNEAVFILGILAIVTMTYGNLLALKQKRIYRILAYSSIAQAGYVLIGIVAYANNGWAASLFYVVSFAASEIIVFISLGILMRFLGIETLDDISGLVRKAPLIAFIFTVGLLNLMGMPPFLGFAGKVYLFWVAVKNGYLVLALSLAANSAISVGYYGLLVKKMLIDEESPKIKEFKAPKVCYFMLSLSVAFLIFVGIYPAILSGFVEKAVVSFL